MELTNFDIEKVLRGAHPKVDQIFKKIIAKDDLPFTLDSDQKFPVAYILNTGFSPGLHWITILFKENCTVIIDPFGLPISWFNFLFLQRRENLPVVQNIWHLQDMTSPVCGYYAIYFMYHLCLGYSLIDEPLNSKDCSILKFF